MNTTTPPTPPSTPPPTQPSQSASPVSTPPPPLSSQARLLAIESSQRALSVALSVEGRHYTHELDASQPQAENLLPTVQQCLQEGATELPDLDAGIYSRGPGSFTSIRIALGFFVALRAVRQKPIYGVSSLAALAWRAHSVSKQPNVLVCLDARGGEIYAGAYRIDEQGIQCHLPDCLLSPDKLSQPAHQCFSRFLETGDVVLAGSGWARFQSQLTRQLSAPQIANAHQSAPTLTATAADLLALVCLPGAEDENIVGYQEQTLAPVYLRDGL